MKLKNLVVGLVMFIFMAMQTACIAGASTASDVKKLVSLYRSQNYLGCVQTSQKMIDENPSNIYAHYYMGLSYLQLGKNTQAIDAFNAVVSLNSNKTLVEYANRGIACLNKPEDCAKYAETTSDLENFIKSNKFYDKSVQAEVNERKLDRIKENINNELGPNANKKSEMPTNDEIANAVKTLAKVGINPMSGMNQAMMTNPELMQMNMLLGNNNQYGNGMNNMLPYLLMGQNSGQNLSPELIQSMMMSQIQMY